MDLRNIKFNVLEMSSVVKALGVLNNLNKVWISQTKFSGESLSILFETVSKLSCDKVDLKLS